MERYQIHISGLKLFGFHGVLPHEAEIGQFFILDLTLEVERSSRADDVSSIVDYGKVSEVVKLAFDSNRYQLIESLADAIFTSLKAFSAIQVARITIAKPNPPIPLSLESVSVTFEREM